MTEALDRIAVATADRLRLAREARAFLKEQKLRCAHQSYDPNDLNSHFKARPDNRPRETKDAFTRAGMFDTPYATLAALGDFTFDALPGASDPAYLAATPEVTLSPAIQAKAAELNHDPVVIYHWVRNHIIWPPSCY